MQFLDLSKEMDLKETPDFPSFQLGITEKKKGNYQKNYCKQS
jgi:hypothetical protein